MICPASWRIMWRGRVAAKPESGPPDTRCPGLNILATDSDGARRRGWVEWAPGIGQNKGPGKFPKVLLAVDWSGISLV
ncbi:MAG TPA: hypothetical protein PLJ71_16640 [Candidatus Hydrogenedentes bacterium]|nr:hypothetical protein [Candidatus Hydrogenedentota bacterium]